MVAFLRCGVWRDRYLRLTGIRITEAPVSPNPPEERIFLPNG